MAKLASSKRAEKSKQSELKELRSTGKVPAVVYGYETENTSLSVDENEFIKVIREVGRNGVIDLEVADSGTTQVMVSEYQFDALKNQITHIDFIAINMQTEVTVDVQIELTGEAPGQKEGGVIEQPLFEVSVTAKPADIPETIEVDISELNIGDSIHVEDIRSKGNFVIENEDADSLVIISAPTEEPEEDENAEEESVEVEATAQKNDEADSEEDEEK
ncbi:50S ribosomal protein L25 [Jeotgalicoccus aerolatus]|uniref:Large ribosomal subunit protein bL25 n=1 Tax=Jeotgalicoccus aerolatus TaxID=709510 RepID=A0ABS4HM72_9STAP|nr:50S ribosomal protein L25/general stress protein Ctc [Jeotgalicoccus aerolatus]MBP1951990.1 large subunit ribosomal protein L25 [Jeotgalicoccus aerolatus]GGE05002.1 50S ribosomal protein L25 [Jeotgalicoccus aerolatus]CAD2071355.1 50S ribosomal protein L25 [Jeotgalicoccus aerolatus]HJG32288.1 50S ribosomal protein L25/general stress protein Ctc [Jeotgalicoccus aerolatus]